MAFVKWEARSFEVWLISMFGCDWCYALEEIPYVVPHEEALFV